MFCLLRNETGESLEAAQYSYRSSKNNVRIQILIAYDYYSLGSRTTDELMPSPSWVSTSGGPSDIQTWRDEQSSLPLLC